MPVNRAILPPRGPVRRRLAWVVAMGTLGGGVFVVQAAVLARAIDAVLMGGQGLDAVRPALVALAALASVRALVSWSGDTSAARAASAFKRQLRGALAWRLVEKGPAGLARESAGEIANTLGAGADTLDAYIAQYLPLAATSVLVPLTIAAVVLAVDPLSALVLVVTYPLVPLFMVLVGSAARDRTRQQWLTLSRMSARFVDALQGLPTLKAFGRVDAEADTLAERSETFRRLTMQVLRLAFLSALVLELIATLSTAIVAVEVGLRLLYARLAFRDAFFVLLVTPEFYRPLRALGAAFHAGMSGREAYGRIASLLGAPGVIDDPPRPAARRPLTDDDAQTLRADRSVAPTRHPPSICFDRVCWSYGDDRAPAVDDVSFDIGAGMTVALVGPSGAGKTTLGHLLLRFIEPQAGAILVDGRPLAAMSAREWRLRVAWVPQRPHLFHGTLRDNLRVARPNATGAQLDQAVRLANAEDLVATLPRGYDTPLGERGTRLSGGEAQRVALARAFLRDAPVIVLDEPTSQLDPGHEARIADALARLRSGRTVLLIAHRLTTVFTADAIVVLEDGRIVESGTHARLVAAGGQYARMVTAFRGAA